LIINLCVIHVLIVPYEKRCDNHAKIKNMKRILFGVAMVAAIILAIFLYRQSFQAPEVVVDRASVEERRDAIVNPDTPRISVIAQNLDTPWGIAFLPDGSILVTERKGTVRLIDSQGQLVEAPVATIQNALEIGEGGLLGIALHPQFEQNNLVYLYYTYQGEGNNTLNRVVKMTYRENSLSDEQIIVDKIPGASNHNGGRIRFGPDGNLYITTGDSQEPSLSQNTNSLAGKILRVTDKGEVLPDSPFGNAVYSYGHRNPQGIAWDSTDNLWSTEHGRSSPSGYDELNRIENGINYGWPDNEGDEASSGMVGPVKHSGSDTTWAPGGTAVVRDRVYFSGLRGRALYSAAITGTEVGEIEKHFDNEYGRIREVITGPDGMLYISTSNRDGRGIAGLTDDRIIRINPEKL